MRLFTKYFLFGMLVFGLAFSVSGYFLLHYSMESSLAREVDFALKQYQYDKFTVQSAMLTYSDISIVLEMENGAFPEDGHVFTMWKSFPDGQLYSYKQALPGNGEISEGQAGSEELEITGSQSGLQDQEDAEGQTNSGVQALPDELVRNLFSGLAEEISVPAAFFAEDGTLIYSKIEGLDPSFLDSLSEEAHVYRFWDIPDGGSVLVGSILNFDRMSLTNSVWNVTEDYQGTIKVDPEFLERGGSVLEVLPDMAAEQTGIMDGLEKIYFVTQWDIGKTISQQQTLRQYFTRCYLIAMTAGMVLLGFLSALLTGPLKRMSKAAGRMAEGYYEERLAISGKDEIGELAGSFNRMADAVEEKIGELSRAAREKEDFVANFAHELKTPLTSIIGYADMIYQRDLPREDIRRASWHIWNEGMRLEALSFKLLELTVLGRQEFPLVEMPADELLRDVAEGLSPLMEEKKTELSLQAEEAYVRVDYDLLKTLLLNLVDNSVKAGAGRVELYGEIKGEEYRIRVRDNGCGMEEEALSRITEAFYMVDKARSRKQHGAGLGLALADRIAGVHGSRLDFKSRKGEGTEVSFSLKCEKGGTADGEEG